MCIFSPQRAAEIYLGPEIRQLENASVAFERVNSRRSGDDVLDKNSFPCKIILLHLYVLSHLTLVCAFSFCYQHGIKYRLFPGRRSLFEGRISENGKRTLHGELINT